MTKSADRRANRNARLIAATMIVTSGATVAYTPADARESARQYGFDSLLMNEVNWNLVCEILNLRIPRKTNSKPRRFEPYADTFRPEYREPNHDPAHARRDARPRWVVEDERNEEFLSARQW